MADCSDSCDKGRCPGLSNCPDYWSDEDEMGNLSFAFDEEYPEENFPDQE